MTSEHNVSPVDHDTSSSAAEVVGLGVYVAASDIGRSRAFYEGLFARRPTVVFEDFVGFTVAGGLFAIVSRARYHPGSSPGSGSVPYIAVNDLDSVRSRAALLSVEPIPDIISEPGIELLKLFDPDGQLVEFYRLTGS